MVTREVTYTLVAIDYRAPNLLAPQVTREAQALSIISADDTQAATE